MKLYNYKQNSTEWLLSISIQILEAVTGGVLQNFANFTVKQLCLSLFIRKLQDWTTFFQNTSSGCCWNFVKIIRVLLHWKCFWLLNAENKHGTNPKSCSVKYGLLETSENFFMLKLLYVHFNLLDGNTKNIFSLRAAQFTSVAR